LIKIFIVNFHYDLIMPNAGCAVQQFYKRRKDIWICMDIFCI